MIFITVGTDHHQFTRLLENVDRLIGKNIINAEDVLVQYGLNKYRFKKNIQKKDFMTFPEMILNIKNSCLTITHASSTAMLAMINGKVPIVVPRRPEFQEIIDNHQLEFSARLQDQLPMIVVWQIENLGSIIQNYEIESGDIKQRMRLNESDKKKAVIELNRLIRKWF